MMLEHVRVRTQLTLGFGLLALVVVLVSALSLHSLRNGQDNFARYVQQSALRLALAADAVAATNARAIAVRNLVLVTTEEDVAAEKSAVSRAHDKVSQSLSALKAAAAGVGGDEARLLQQVLEVESRYGTVALAIVKLAVDGQRDDAIARMNQECRQLLAQLIKSADAYIAHVGGKARAEVAAGQADYEARRNLLVGGVVLAIGLSAALGLLITRRLLASLGAEPAELGAAARRVAEGDLGPVAGAEHAPQGSVLALLGQMQASLAALVAQVREASDAMAIGSREIATGNSDLSQRTELQASSLQQTASSMDEMSASVRHNADTARQATELAASASSAAVHGGEVVGQVVATMADITQSSRKIGEIIATIDGIAFQTNILALNAAVEAARAGEQGRGFAVVAGEVRNLSQRSAEAAREIRGLIQASVEKVDNGSKLVANAGNAMDGIVAQVQRVASLMSEISNATHEQSSGINQVTQAVTQLDQVTQQNAALVEQSAAAASSLQQQAAQLTQVVSVFRLHHGQHEPASSLALPALH